MILVSWCLAITAIVFCFRKKMIAMAIYLFFFCFLTLGQAVYLKGELQDLGWAIVLNSYISQRGFDFAALYVMLFSFGMVVLVALAPRYRRRVESNYIFLPSKRFYLGVLLFLLGTYFTLIFGVVGLGEFLTSSRPGYQSGATVFIVLLCVGVFPICLKLALGQIPSRWDIVLFLLSVLMTGAFSRIHSIMYLTMVAITAYYGLRWAERRFGFRRIFVAASVAILGGSIFFVVGAARDALNFSSGGLAGVVDFLINNPDKSLFSLEYNYTVGVEGMSGLAGAMSYADSTPSAVLYDGGLYPLARGALQWIPGFAKALLQSAFDWLERFNWYSGSIVSPGIEDSFKSFGWLGFIVFVGLHYLFIWRPVKLIEASRKPKILLRNYLLVALSIFMVRGSWFVWVAYLVTYSILFAIIWPVFANQIRKKLVISA